jgi:predicted dehydrogenase
MKVALVGLGYWGPNLLRVLNKIGVLASAYDIDEEKVSKFSADPSYRHITFGNNWKAALSEDIDAVVIATPPSAHYEVAMDAMNAGKHVFIEKPMTLDVTEAKDLVKHAATFKLKLMVGHIFLFVPEVLKVKEIIESGDIGEILYIHASRLNLGKFQKSNVISDLAPHDISIFNFLVDDKVSKVYSNGYGFVNKNVVEVAKVTLEYSKGTVCDLHLSWLDPRKKRTTTVVGTKKMIVYDMMSDEKIKVYDKGVDGVDTSTHDAYLLSYRHGDIYSPQTGVWEPLETECRHFIECIEGDRQIRTDGQNGLDVVEVLSASLKSLDTGDWVCL